MVLGAPCHTSKDTFIILLIKGSGDCMERMSKWLFTVERDSSSRNARVDRSLPFVGRDAAPEVKGKYCKELNKRLKIVGKRLGWKGEFGASKRNKVARTLETNRRIVLSAELKRSRSWHL